MNPEDPALLATWQAFESSVPDWSCDETLGAGAVEDAEPALPRLRTDTDVPDDPEYRIGAVLGRGGTAVVYEAEHVPLERPVAVKALHDAIRGPGAAAALIGEARIAGGLSHPNIVPVHALGLDADARPLLVMERIAGLPWSRLLQEPDHPMWHRWPGDALDRTLHVALRVADALVSAHERGVLHRDVKPSNVILGPTGQVYLVDWGIAVRVGPDGQVTAPLGGTPAYMAPEMFDPTARLDARCDVYLLGASIYTALTGRAPREGGSVAELARIAAGPPPPLPEAPPPLARVIAAAMDPDREARPPTVEAFRQALVTFIDRRAAIDEAARAEAARERFESLRERPGEEPARDAARIEAAFAFRTALEAWPDYPAAQAGLTALLESAIADDLVRGDVASARRALAELPRPNADLATLVDAGEEAARVDRAALEAARRRASELDARAGGAARVKWMLLLLFLLSVAPLLGGTLRLLGMVGPTPEHGWRAATPFVLASLMELLVRRRPIVGPGARYNRHLVRLAQLCMLGASLVWLVGLVRQQTISEICFDLLLTQAMAFGTAAALLDRRLLIASAGAAVTSLLVLRFDPYSELLLVIFLATTVILFQWIWSHEGAGDSRPIDG